MAVHVDILTISCLTGGTLHHTPLVEIYPVIVINITPSETYMCIVAKYFQAFILHLSTLLTSF